MKESELLEGFSKGDVRCLARLISLIENGSERADKIVKALYKGLGDTKIIGITGAPGVGKSTLVDKLAQSLAALGEKVGVLAIDPSSPFTGGAILGDRIRMSSTIGDNVYIRSLASRGALGGLTPHTMECVFALTAFGFDYIIVETVGVGQGEVDVVKISDVRLVALAPGLGDDIQAMKAGILEIADIFVVNKGDMSGADRVEKDLHMLLTLSAQEKTSWKPLVIRTVATTGDGVENLRENIDKFIEFQRETGSFTERRIDIMRRYIENKTYGSLVRNLQDTWGREIFEESARMCVNEGRAPWEFVQLILDKRCDNVTKLEEADTSSNK